MSTATDSLSDVDRRAADDGDVRPPFRRLAIMALVAVLLAVICILTVLPGLAPPLPTRGGERVVELDPKQVQQVEVVPRDGAPYSFARKGDAWVMSRPQGADVVPSDRLDGFLETLAGLTRLVVIDEPDQNLAEFGLEPPRAVVTIRGGKEVTLALGDRNPPLTALYVQILPGTNIVLAGAVLLWEFDKLVVLSKTQPVEP